MSYPRIWVFDINRRVYVEPASKRTYGGGGPIWREHWVERAVVGETRVSWILSGRDQTRVPKKGGRGIAFSEAEIDRLAWANDHVYPIERQLRGITPERLDAIAAIVGYEPRMPQATP